MIHHTTPPFKIITAAMLKAGWYAGPDVPRRTYDVIRDNENGTYVVENPELTLERERIREGGTV